MQTEMIDLLDPLQYPLYITLSACIVLMVLLFIVSYKKIPLVVGVIFFIGSLIFIHLDLATYKLTYPIMAKLLSLFQLSNIPKIGQIVLGLAGLILLSLLPLLVFIIPLIMLDENLTKDIEDSDQIKLHKSIAIVIVGLVVNLIFTIQILTQSGLFSLLL